MFLCFVIALIILAIYSSKYFALFLVPIFHIIRRMKRLSAKGPILVDGTCPVMIHDLGMELSIITMQGKLCETHNVLHSNTNVFRVCERKVVIHYEDSSGKQTQIKIIEFYILLKDVRFWTNLADDFGKKSSGE